MHDKIKQGDIGTVIGPCDNSDLADKAKRVCVDFGPVKGRVNILAQIQIEHEERLAGGYQKHDRVRSLIVHDKIKQGDIGTVIGPCSNDVADKAKRVCVDFGPVKGRVNILAKDQIGRV